MSLKTISKQKAIIYYPDHRLTISNDHQKIPLPENRRIPIMQIVVGVAKGYSCIVIWYEIIS